MIRTKMYISPNIKCCLLSLRQRRAVKQAIPRANCANSCLGIQLPFRAVSQTQYNFRINFEFGFLDISLSWWYGIMELAAVAPADVSRAGQHGLPHGIELCMFKRA